jgi:polar amino acid transport system substrate-binding protein
MKLLKALVAVTLCLATGLAGARSFDEIKKGGRIVIATEGQFAPFNYFKGATLTGFEIDLGDAMAKKMGLAVEWKPLSFDALLAGLNQDRWDLVIASFAITNERSKAVSFTNPHYCSGGVIVAKDAAIKTAKDLTGKVVAVQTGTSYLENVKKVAGVKEVKNFPQDTDARSALITGRTDAWVTDKFAAKAAIEAAPAAGLKIGDFLFVEKIAIAVRKDNASVLAAANKALAELMADGTYKALSEKYFKEDIRCK